LPKKKKGVLKRGTAGSGLANDLKSEGNRAGSFVLAKPLRKVSEKDRAEHEEQRRLALELEAEKRAAAQPSFGLGLGKR